MSTTIGAIGKADYPSKINASGFSAIPSGIRGHMFMYIGESAIWWSSTITSENTNAFTRNLSCDDASIINEGTYTDFDFGCSVRCVKD